MKQLRNRSWAGHAGLVLWLVAAVFAGSSGCKRKGPPGGSGSDAASVEAAKIFVQRCVSCHGQLGKGDGPASAALTPKPRNFTSEEWQKSITDEALEKIIVYGGAAVGKSAAMPGNPDLDGKKAVVTALRQYVRNLAGK